METLFLSRARCYVIFGGRRRRLAIAASAWMGGAMIYSGTAGIGIAVITAAMLALPTVDWFDYN
ncbi:MAG: hypothetical protein RBT60_13785 [Candidatus Krumholzibacteria bacterium]|nr:hypothetical protein [Candidatus Krumholzibacteria bacterium]